VVLAADLVNAARRVLQSVHVIKRSFGSHLPKNGVICYLLVFSRVFVFFCAHVILAVRSLL